MNTRVTGRGPRKDGVVQQKHIILFLKDHVH